MFLVLDIGVPTDKNSITVRVYCPEKGYSTPKNLKSCSCFDKVNLLFCYKIDQLSDLTLSFNDLPFFPDQFERVGLVCAQILKLESPGCSGLENLSNLEFLALFVPKFSTYQHSY